MKLLSIENVREERRMSWILMSEENASLKEIGECNVVNTLCIIMPGCILQVLLTRCVEVRPGGYLHLWKIHTN